MRLRTPCFIGTTVLCIITFTSMRGQDKPIEWGVISKEDLAMKSYPADTNAEALVLCDYGERYMSDDFGMIFKRHERIKIFTPAGYDWANYYITLYSKDREERLRGLEGATYLLKPDGGIMKTELDDNSVFEEEVDKEHTRYRFTLPALQPGCIIEVAYTIESKTIFFPRKWEFQSTIPTLWSEYRFTFPRAFSFGGVTRGYEPFFIKEETDVKQHVGGESSAYLGTTMPTCFRHRWVVKDAPALRDEPYITTLEDYNTSVDMQLAEYFSRMTMSAVKVLKTWEVVRDELLDENDFGERCDPTSDIRKLAESVTAGIADPEQKLIALYNYVKNTIVWDGKNRLYAHQDFDDVLELRKGNSAEMTLLLIAMLHASGIEAAPVILSTRSNGTIQDLYPILTQFNYVITRAVVGGKTLFLDPTDPLRPYDLLPTSVLNVRGLVIRKGPLEWVVISAQHPSIHKTLALLRLNETGEVEGTLESVGETYSALSERRSLRDKSELDVAKGLFDADKYGLTLDSVTVDGKDSITVPLHMTAQVSAPGYAQTAGDLIYFNPSFVDRIDQNPFKLPERKFPVDMSYCRQMTTIVSVTVPDAFEVKELPPDLTRGIGRDMTFTRSTVSDGKQVRMTVKYASNRVDYPPSMYKKLKDFYDDMVAAESNQIVFQRRSASRATPLVPAKETKAPKKKRK